MNKLYAFRGAAVVAALVLVFYILSPAITPQLAFALNGNANLNGFIWENDDDSSPDGNSQLAAGNGAITVPRGSRLNLRTQIKNTGTAMDLSKIGLFYDRGDGMWSRVRNTTHNSPSGDAFLYPTRLIDLPSGGISGHVSSAIDPTTGNQWVSYGGFTNGDLRVAEYVGSGGNCSNSAWNCTIISNTGSNASTYNSMAFDSTGTPWISYHIAGSNALMVATYVGTGGNCTSSAWSCTAVEDVANTVGQYSSIAIDSTDSPWISYYDASATSMKAAKYVGTGGNCTSTAWDCSTVDNTGTATGQYTSIAIDNTDTPWVSFYDTTNTSLRVAKYVGTGGNCTSTAWNCSAVDNTGTNTGQWTSIAINPKTNVPWVSYQNVTGTSLKVASYIGSSGTCTDTAWDCTVVDNTGTSTGEATSITFDSEGSAWVSYRDVTNNSTRLARYTMPSHSNFNCSDTSWNCMTIEGIDTGRTSTKVVIDANGDANVVMYGNYADGVFVRKVTRENLLLGEAQSIQQPCPVLAGFKCIGADASGTAGQYNSIAISPSGVPWISYYDSGSSSLNVASMFTKYDDAGSYCGGEGFDCDIVDNTGTTTGQFTSIAIDPSGAPWVSYYDQTNTALRVAKYVGSGGNCTNAAWNCSAVDDTAAVGANTSIAIDASGNPWVAYFDTTNSSLRIATYVGSGGNCTDAAWNCITADNTGSNTGQQPSIAFDTAGSAWVSYWDAGSTSLRVANYVGTGGNCTSAAWNCSVVDNTGTSTGQASSIAVDATGTPWVAFQDVTTQDLRIAKYVGSGGNCTDAAWNCSILEGDRLSLSFGTSVGISLAIDPAGNPSVAYREGSAASLRFAKYVGSGGNCTDSAWNCFTVDDDGAANKGGYTALAFDQNGRAWIAYQDSTNGAVRVAYSVRQGEVLIASSQRASGALSESHVDMTTINDTTNRDDADCVGGGTWNNGVMVFGDMGAIGTLPDGTGTAQCTELVFTLDFSQSQLGATYRFMVASIDNFTSGRSLWRGPVSIAGGATPTITIGKDYNAGLIMTKSNNIRLPDCTDTSWGCGSVVTTDDVGTFGSASSLTIDRQGMPWVAYYNATSGDLAIAKYVGTGGTGCASSAWNCTVIDSTNDVGKYSSLVFDDTGNPWVSYYDTTNGNLRVARYVGSSGSGCASSAWTCTAVDTTNDVGQYGSMTVDLSGNPIISYYDATGGNLRIARYLSGSTLGTGCAVNTWSCVAIDTTNDVGQYSSLTIDDAGTLWASYYDATNGDLRVARQNLSGSTGCAVTDWQCSTIESTNDVGKYSSITASGYTVAVAYYESASGSCDNSPTTECSLHFANRFAGGGGAGCADASWWCTIIDNPTGSGDLGKYVATSVDGKYFAMSYYDAVNGDLKLARYDLDELGGTGSGCTTTLDVYCSVIDTSNDVGAYSSIVTADDGTGMIAYYDASSGNLRIAKEHRSTKAFTTNDYAQRYKGGRETVGNSPFGRYSLSLGRTATAADGTCSGASTDYLGICALYQNSGNYDTLVAQTNESPVLTAIIVRDTNGEYPTVQWIGRTTLAPNTAGNTGDIVMQAYNASSNTWETIATNSTASDCNSADCTLRGIVSSPTDSYYQTNYVYNAWPSFVNGEMLIRIYQEASSSTGITFKTDQFSAFSTSQKIGSGSLFQDGVERPLNQR